MAYGFFGLISQLFLLQASIIERTVQYIKDRTEIFDDYFPYRKKNCISKRVRQWQELFICYYNINTSLKFTAEKSNNENPDCSIVCRFIKVTQVSFLFYQVLKYKGKK